MHLPGPVPFHFDVAGFQAQFVKYPPNAQVVLFLQQREKKLVSKLVLSAQSTTEERKKS